MKQVGVEYSSYSSKREKESFVDVWDQDQCQFYSELGVTRAMF